MASPLPDEKWRAVVGYEGSYEVSSLGGVRSLDRVVTYPNGVKRKFEGRFLKLAIGQGGYPSVQLKINGVRKSAFVHHLVLEAFVGPRPDGCIALHWDDNRNDNRVENLRWGTHSENRRDAVRNGRHSSSHVTACTLGHLLADWNLVKSHLRNGRRRCRSCHNARSAPAVRSGKVEFSEMAEAKYQTYSADHQRAMESMMNGQEPKL